MVNSASGERARPLWELLSAALTPQYDERTGEMAERRMPTVDALCKAMDANPSALAQPFPVPADWQPTAGALVKLTPCAVSTLETRSHEERHHRVRPGVLETVYFVLDGPTTVYLKPCRHHRVLVMLCYVMQQRVCDTT